VHGWRDRIKASLRSSLIIHKDRIALLILASNAGGLVLRFMDLDVGQDVSALVYDGVCLFVVSS